MHDNAILHSKFQRLNNNVITKKERISQVGLGKLKGKENHIIRIGSTQKIMKMN